MKQAGLFEPTVPSPLCVRQKPCGARAILGPPEAFAACVNQVVTCQTCGRVGEVSTAKVRA